MISNIIITYKCERSERALGEIALSCSKLGARLMVRGTEGDTYQKKKEHVSKYNYGENGTFLTPTKETLTRDEKGHL